MKLRLLAAIAFVLATAACGGAARLTTPAGFAKIDSDDDYAYRATTAQGVVIATRTNPNKLKGNLDFWADSIDLKLREAGYAPEGTKDVTTRSGLNGKQMRYTTTKNGREHAYWVTVFLTKKRVVVVEAAGDKQPFEKAQPALEQAIGSLEAD
jgi:hypothetical protein